MSRSRETVSTLLLRCQQQDTIFKPMAETVLYQHLAPSASARSLGGGERHPMLDFGMSHPLKAKDAGWWLTTLDPRGHVLCVCVHPLGREPRAGRP